MESLITHATSTEPTTEHSGRSVQGVSKYPQRLARTHVDYWKPKLWSNVYNTSDGEVRKASGLCVKIQHCGRRETVNLHLTNREKAAVRARDLYLDIVAKGWDAALAKFKPEMEEKPNEPTVGEFLTEVCGRSDLKPKTFRLYAGYFRRIVADTFSLNDGTAKFDHRTGQHREWQKRVDAVRLSAITSDTLNDWRNDYIRDAGNSPLDRNSAIRSANSYLRCARALFSRKWIDRLKVKLPEPLPFAGVRVEKTRPPRYKSKINPALLYTAARNELWSFRSAASKRADAEAEELLHRSAFIVFSLGFGAGLRKSEIDGLEWRHIRFTHDHSEAKSAPRIVAGAIHVEPTEFRDVKTKESEAEVEIDAQLAADLHAFKAHAKVAFVIPSDRKVKAGSDLQQYRAEGVYDCLYKWLRKKGVTDRKPLHTLRKEFGSLINARFGLYATMTALRHSNIETTSSYYTDNKQRIALPLSEIAESALPHAVND
jgi:hypothetical protein